MISRSLVRVLVTSAALGLGALLAGCNSDGVTLANNAKANQPVPPKLIAAMAEKNMDLQSPILIRLFKEEAELEVWKQDRTGHFALLKTYPICRWSGDLGPKIREGDRQAPEGFYSISPAQMNPQSAYYLSFNTGYPNAFDRALGRTGSELMVHGDCSSRGCYAMTDEQIAEIYALGREAFFGGQRAFQFQAYPFRMTAANLARHRNNPNMPFWRMIKEGNDDFEVTKLEPKVDFCEKKYVFDAAKPPGATRDPVFEASAKCPAYVIPDDIAAAVKQKEQRDDAEFAKLVAEGTPVAKLNTGIDGGMNKVFAAKLPDGNTGLSDGGSGQDLTLLANSKAPGTIPADVNPPHPPSLAQPDEAPVGAVAAAAPAVRTTMASATPNAPSSGGFFGRLARKAGFGAASVADSTAPAAASYVAPAGPAKSKKTILAKRFAPAHAETKKPEARQASARPAPTTTAAAEPATQNSLVAGAQPIVQSNSFDSRFTAVK
ncbi:MAG TPA: murein L,D-transpeptidase family protein [Bradyrhizobium sp.]|nr:murein L,D-transpeptidase family protein [Bradyrhizobium sp.]